MSAEPTKVFYAGTQGMIQMPEREWKFKALIQPVDATGAPVGDRFLTSLTLKLATQEETLAQDTAIITLRELYPQATIAVATQIS